MAVEPGPPPSPIVRPYLEFRPLSRAVGIASDPKKLILAAIGLMAMTAGGSGLDRLFGGPGLPEAWSRPGSAIGAVELPTWDGPAALAWLVSEPARAVMGPFIALFRDGAGPAGWTRSALMAIWAAVIWGLFGGAIARIAVVQASRSGRVGLGMAVRFALSRAVPLIAAPLTPMLGVGLIAAACGAFGLLYRLPGGVGAVIAGASWFLPLLGGLLMAVVLLGLAAGWPLMQATVAAEGEDAPDALSRSYSYVNQRLGRYLAHVAAAWAIGAFGLLLVIGFARVVLALADWGVGLGRPGDYRPVEAAEAARLAWVGLVGWLVHAWIYSYFWSAMSLIYLVLRRDVDGAEWDAVYMPPHDEDRFADGPKGPTPGGDI